MLHKHFCFQSSDSQIWQGMILTQTYTSDDQTGFLPVFCPSCSGSHDLHIIKQYLGPYIEKLQQENFLNDTYQKIYLE